MIRVVTRHAVYAAALLALWLSGVEPARVRAQARRPALQWTRAAEAASCIDPRSLATCVERVSGRALVAPRDADYTIEGHIETANDVGYRARISVTGADGMPRGERVLVHRTPDCRAFDALLAFVIALAIDPDLDLEAIAPSEELLDRAPEEVLLDELTKSPPKPVEHAAPPPRVAIVAPASVCPRLKRMHRAHGG